MDLNTFGEPFTSLLADMTVLCQNFTVLINIVQNVCFYVVFGLYKDISYLIIGVFWKDIKKGIG